nr:MAG TPA: hypothetical protein [Caudoviricetes sp.]DAN21390.1 MAG TPA_asm: hypothetical protein [Bacteriophage sp.]DAX31796.1 MAG TPA: hypothetical protein [Bacteriophage sp.]
MGRQPIGKNALANTVVQPDRGVKVRNLRADRPLARLRHPVGIRGRKALYPQYVENGDCAVFILAGIRRVGGTSGLVHLVHQVHGLFKNPLGGRCHAVLPPLCWQSGGAEAPPGPFLLNRRRLPRCSWPPRRGTCRSPRPRP